MSQIVSIVYKPASIEQQPEDHFSRVPLSQAQLVIGHGIEGDMKGGVERQLNIMGAEALAGLNARGFKTAPGEMGEQIVLAGIDVPALQPGDTLILGESARVVVMKNRTGCTRFHRIQGFAPAEAAGQMGVIARVLKEGIINVGDTVQIESAEIRVES